jgi:hypothetical protein
MTEESAGGYTGQLPVRTTRGMIGEGGNSSSGSAVAEAGKLEGRDGGWGDGTESVLVPVAEEG